MAIGILTSPEAVRTFTKSITTFVQVGAVTHNANEARLGASRHLAVLAQKYHSVKIANVALDVQSAGPGGHFGKVIATIDQMIAVLREEEQHDIDHRDRCERAQGKNSNDMEALNASIDATANRIEDLQEEERHLENDIAALESHIEHTTNEMKDALDLRNDAVSEFKQAVKDDTE